jgi:hypothetical protein
MIRISEAFQVYKACGKKTADNAIVGCSKSNAVNQIGVVVDCPQ